MKFSDSFHQQDIKRLLKIVQVHMFLIDFLLWTSIVTFNLFILLQEAPQLIYMLYQK